MAVQPRGERTKRTMIDAAERLIAERGLAALSLREVAVVAGQRNHSAVQYHFGTREGLVEAVFEARMADIDQRRGELVARLVADGRGDDPLALCDAIARPLAEAVAVEPPGWYGRFLAQVSRSAPQLLSVQRPVMASLDHAGARLVAVMVEVPPALRAERLRLAVRATVQMLADHEEERARGGDARPETDGPVFVAHVVDLLHAMVTAPPSPALAAELDRTGLTG